VEQKIINGWFPYTPTPRGPVRSPPGLSLDRLHPALVGLMQRCFVDGHADPRLRPSAAEWESALKDVEKALSTCPQGRIFAARINPTPRCAAQRMPLAPIPAAAVTPPTTVVCPRCATLNLSQRAYCRKCAVHLHPLAACPHCGQLTAQGAQVKYCEACGRRL
jgi:DNA-binding helix-hairpin-helix protein with protein kinase domain